MAREAFIETQSQALLEHEEAKKHRSTEEEARGEENEENGEEVEEEVEEEKP